MIHSTAYYNVPVLEQLGERCTLNEYWPVHNLQIWSHEAAPLYPLSTIYQLRLQRKAGVAGAAAGVAAGSGSRISACGSNLRLYDSAFITLCLKHHRVAQKSPE